MQQIGLIQYIVSLINHILTWFVIFDNTQSTFTFLCGRSLLCYLSLLVATSLNNEIIHQSKLWKHIIQIASMEIAAHKGENWSTDTKAFISSITACMIDNATTNNFAERKRAQTRSVLTFVDLLELAVCVFQGMAISRWLFWKTSFGP